MTFIPPREYNHFVGKFLKDVEDDIEKVAKSKGLSVNILDPSYPRNIDVYHKRLNVVIDENSVVRSFNVG